MKSLAKTLRFISVFLFVGFFSSGCGKSFTSKVANWVSWDNVQNGVLYPETDQLDSNCMSSSKYDSCIFFKSPAAQEKSLESSLASVENKRHFGVKLTGMDESGRLKNSKIEIVSLNSTAVDLKEVSHVKPEALNPKESYLEQVMTFYWAQYIFHSY